MEGRILLGFFLGYAAILAVPGPNMLAIGGVAALRGLRGAAPLCLGTALGAGTLSTALLLCTGAAGLGGNWADAGRMAGAVLLLGVAASVLRLPPPDEGGVPAHPGGDDTAAHFGRDLAAFAAGFCTAASNPLTAAFFAAQFMGPLGAAWDAAAAAPLGVVGMALGFFLGVAALLSRPAARQLVRRWHRPARLLAGSALLLSALTLLRAALHG